MLLIALVDSHPLPTDLQRSLLPLIFLVETKENKLRKEAEALVSFHLHQKISLIPRQLIKLILCLTTSECVTQRPTSNIDKTKDILQILKLICRMEMAREELESNARFAKKCLKELTLSANCPVTSSISSMQTVSNHGSRNKMHAHFAKALFQSVKTACP